MLMDQLTKYIDAPTRVLMAIIFIISGINKIGAFEATQGYMNSVGVPGILLAPTIAFEVSAGILLVIGFRTREIALLLGGFSFITAVVFHMDFGNQSQMLHFMKNLAMTGGFLMLAKFGAPGFSLDQWLIQRKQA